MQQASPAPKKEKSTPRKKFPVFSSEGYYFETRNRRFWRKTSLGWCDISKEDFQIFLNTFYGLSTRREKGGPSQCDRAIARIQETQWVNVVGDLAGYHGPEVFIHNNVRILVPHAPNLVIPFEGDYATWLEFFLGMLPGEAGEHLNCWSAAAVQSAYGHRLGTNIIPILCGPHSCGKSLFQQVFTVAVGGRVSFPYQVMTGVTPFNEHLFAAEHLMIEDEYSSGDNKSRNQLGTALKNFVANKQKLNHGKGKMPFTSPELLQFLTLSLNDELENIAQLPQKHPSLDGKVSLYDCQCSAMPMPTGTPEEKAAFWAQLMRELPCLIYDWIHKTPMPEKWRSGRFMVPWRAERISSELDVLQPEMKLREIIHALYWSIGDSTTFMIQSYGSSAKIGSATEIECDLRYKDSPCKPIADDLLRNQGACGRYLQRLCDRFPREFSFKRTDEKRVYTIKKPVNDGSNAS